MGVGCVTKSRCVRRHCVHHLLEICLRTANDAEDLTGRRLLLVRLTGLSMRRSEAFPSLCQLAVACLELLLCLRQALLQVTDPGVFVFGRLAANMGLGFLRLGGLWTLAHQPLLASYEVAGDRLRRTRQSGQGYRQPEPVTAGGLCAGAVNLSKNWGVCGPSPATQPPSQAPEGER